MLKKRFFSFLLMNCILVSCSNKDMKNANIETDLSSIEMNKIDTSKYDPNPPIFHGTGWGTPQPLPAPIDGEGNELEPFITLAGDELYFLFTPDFSVSEAKRALDGVSGIYYSKKENGVWSPPERLELGGDNALNGCVYTDGKTLWFCSLREGNYNPQGDYYTASLVNGQWRDWQNAGELLNRILDVEAIHFSSDQHTMIFSAVLPNGYGYSDLWQIHREEEGWAQPEDLGSVVNSPYEEIFPYLSEDGTQLWFTSFSRLGYPGYAIFRSIRQDGAWGEPQEILSNYVSEVSIDRAGNLYFTHILNDENDELMETKIYVAYKETAVIP